MILRQRATKESRKDVVGKGRGKQRERGEGEGERKVWERDERGREGDRGRQVLSQC